MGRGRERLITGSSCVPWRGRRTKSFRKKKKAKGGILDQGVRHLGRVSRFQGGEGPDGAGGGKKGKVIIIVKPNDENSHTRWGYGGQNAT